MRALCILIISLFLLSANGRDADDRQSFLFTGQEAEDLIIEYQIDLGNIDEYYEALGEEAPPPDKEIHRIPSFLTSTYEFDRVVNWYSPWCAHCQKFKPKFVQLAQSFQESSNKILNQIEFHAISCSAHHWLCKASSIQGYPIVRSYRIGSAEFSEIKRFTATEVAANFDVALTDKLENFEDIELQSYKEDVYDVLGAAMDAYRKTKTDIFHDATVSLLFALQFDVNLFADDERVRRGKVEAFKDWIDLLFWTLPSSWKVLTLINDLRTNNDIGLMTNTEVVDIVEANKDVVLPDPSVLWTGSCQSRERQSEGYTCGLWSLFHIISIGVVEQHHAVIGDTVQVSTEYVARTLRDYVNNFLGCKVCKRNFNKLYKKDCGKKNSECIRFHQKPKRGNVDPRKEKNTSYWRDFPLWVWEIHNSFNLEVLRERKKSVGEVPTDEEESKVIYPSRESCPKCRTPSGDWDEAEVYKHLKSQYWPEGIHNFRYVVLKRKKEDLTIRAETMVDESGSQWLYIMLTVVITYVTRHYQKSRKIKSEIRKNEDRKRI